MHDLHMLYLLYPVIFEQFCYIYFLVEHCTFLVKFWLINLS